LPASKLLSLTEAVSRLIPDGSAVVLGTCLETLIPFAAGHEVIRQGKSRLTLIGPISDILFDQIIGAGGVEKVQAAWVGNVITGSGYPFRRAAEEGRLLVEDHSNLTLAMALKAGAMGLPFLPTRTALGSDLLRDHPGLQTFRCPLTGEPLVAVAAIRPDVAVIHVQRSDPFGNVHLWGNLGVTREACLASRRVLVTAEEIVSPERIRSDPNRVPIPGFRVSAVAHVPLGAHPSPVPGFYNRDHSAFLDYRKESLRPEAYAEWRRRWVDPVRTPADYAALLGTDRVEALRPKRRLLSEPVDYGY